MFSSFTFLLASAVAAQAASSSASAASSSPTSNPYIPTDISDTCGKYLQTFNDDPDLAACTSTLLAASSAFGSGATSASKDTVTSALTNICSQTTTSSCSQSLISGKLSQFYAQCSAELTSSPNKQVMTMYDTVFVLLPLLGAVCSKDDDGNPCVFSSNVNSSATPSIARRDSSSGETAYMPDADAIGANNLVFLGLTGKEIASKLCTTCTKNVITSYTSFQNAANYGPGLTQSLLMKNEPTLYTSVVNTCGSDFLTNAVQAAGGLGQGSTTGSSGALSLRAGAGGVLSTLIGALVAALIL